MRERSSDRKKIMKTGGSTGGPLALALAAGYLLGRRHKTRLAFMLGAAALTGRLSGVTGQLMRSGTKVLGSGDGPTGGLGKAAGEALGKAAGEALGKAAGEAVPGPGEVGDMIRQDLTSVAKRAVATAVSNQIESLSDQLHDRAEAIREQSAGSVKEKGGAPSEEEEEEEDRAPVAGERRSQGRRSQGQGRQGDRPRTPQRPSAARSSAGSVRSSTGTRTRHGSA
jgi:hypothetical protein